MKVKIKKLSENAVIPSYAKPGDAGMDLTAISVVYDEYGNVSYGTGLAFEIPEGYMGLIFPRSSNSKKDLLLCNSVGIVDSGYRGEVVVKFKPSCSIVCEETKIETVWDSETMELGFADEFVHYAVGERVAQLVIIPHPEIQFIEAEELSETERGEGGFGSTGKK